MKYIFPFLRNYVVQYVLELENFQVAAALSRYLSGNYVQLSCDKFGSHAVQKCLESRQFNSRMIINELLTDIDSLLVNPYGNYVIQTAWVVSQVTKINMLLDPFCVKSLAYLFTLSCRVICEVNCCTISTGIIRC